jgi:hypothetical protein
LKKDSEQQSYDTSNSECLMNCTGFLWHGGFAHVRHLPVERLPLNRILDIAEFIVWSWFISGSEWA